MAFSWDNAHVTVDPGMVLCKVHHINIVWATKVKKNHVRWPGKCDPIEPRETGSHCFSGGSLRITGLCKSVQCV